jgi:Dolichyl-phosphate-mannose-protein mannosyltransferase
MSDPEVRVQNSPTLTTAVWYCLFVVVVISAMAFRLSNLKVAWRTPDETVYMDFATQVAHSGIQGGRTIVGNYNKDKQQWIYPPPLRMGYIYLVAGGMKLFGEFAEQAAVAISSSFSFLGFLVVALLGLRFFDRWTVLIGLAFLSVSPIDLAIARRAWQDSVWGCVGVLLFYLCMEASVSSRPKFWRACFWVVASYFLLIKESALVVYGFCTLWLIGSAWLQQRSLQKCSHIAIMSALVAATSFAALAWCSGGAVPVVETIQHAAQAREWNQYIHQYQSGPWHSFFMGFWVMSPITTLLCIVGGATVSCPPNSRLGVLTLARRQRQIGWAIMCLIFTLVFAATVLPASKNLRYMTILLGPCCLLGGLGTVHLLALAKFKLTIFGYRSVICAVVIVLLLTCLTDYQRFERVFVRYALDDLAIVRVIDYALAAGSNADKAP